MPSATSTRWCWRSIPKLQVDPSLLDRLYVGAAGGAQVPLSAVARFERGTAPLAVRHQGQFPAATISFNLAPGIALSTAETAVQNATRGTADAGGRAHRFAGNATVPAAVAVDASRC